MTLVEVIISSALLFLIITSGTLIFSNIQGHLTLAEKEVRMQQYARQVITQMSREVRQGRDVFIMREDSDPSVNEGTSLYLIVPEIDPHNGSLLGTYKEVRYYYAEDHEKPGSGIKSLYRAWRSNGTSIAFPTDPPSVFSNNRTRLLKEAAALNPGNESYFSENNGIVKIVMMVATYRTRPDSVFVYQVERKFQVDTDVQLRTLKQ
ncbi:MAG: hypothetical protein IV090_08820 [Candidatus Sericytochromatia bacterium]|nr:hypothetical protein [Candidatus Sericytochromatia bacterium]